MASKQAVLRSRAEWVKIIEEWQLSQQQATSWCKDKGIPVSSFFSAYKRLFPRNQSNDKALNLRSTAFQELKEAKVNPGIEIAFKHITIKLSQNFDKNTLLILLKTLERI